MTIAVAVLLLVIIVELWFVYTRLGDILNYERSNRILLRSVSKQVHTRQRKASMQSGVLPEEAELARLGKSTVGRRVVVGGDKDSALHQQLSRQSSVRVDRHEEEDDG